jgi:hypothetical protein
MLQQQFALLLPVTTIFVLLGVLILYVHYSTARHYRIKLLLGPALLLACAGAFPYVGLNLGYAWPAALPESFEYMAHKPIIVDQHKRWIDVLLLSRKPFRTDPRLQRVPWSQAFEDALDQAQAMKEGREGGDIVMERGAANAQAGDSYPNYVPRRVLPQDQIPKAPLQPRAFPQPPPHESPAPAPAPARRQYV